MVCHGPKSSTINANIRVGINPGTIQTYSLTCKAQHGTQDLGRVFIGKPMQWVVSDVSPTGPTNITYNLTPPNYTNTVSFNIPSNGSFAVPYTYYTGGQKSFNVTISKTIGGVTYRGSCNNATTTAVIYDGTEIEI